MKYLNSYIPGEFVRYEDDLKQKYLFHNIDFPSHL